MAASLQDVDSVYEIVWAPGVKYSDVRHAEERQFSVYNFEAADVEKTWEHLRLYEAECKTLLGGNAVLAAFDLCLKCSHLFNILDSRGAISVTERVGVIARIRNLAVGVAKAWVGQQSAAAGALKA